MPHLPLYLIPFGCASLSILPSPCFLHSSCFPELELDGEMAPVLAMDLRDRRLDDPRPLLGAPA